MSILNDRRTIARNECVRILVAELQKRDLSQGDICDIFHCSRSGARNYLRCLAPVIETITAGILKPRTYRLCKDLARVDAVLESLGQVPEPAVSVNKPRSGRRAAISDPTRHIHTLLDDGPWRLSISRVIPRHTELHAAFWAGRIAGAVQCG